MQIKIEKMNKIHLMEIKDKLSEEFDNFWNIEILEKELENPLSEYIVAILENEIVGFAGIWKPIDEAHITNIVTRKDKRRNSIGTKMLEKLIEMSKENNLNCITLEVNEHNENAINLYKKFDFKEVGRRKNYYNNTDDAIIMTLNIK